MSAVRDRTRAVVWLLLIGILPSLTFMGHWPALHVDIPGTNLYLGLPDVGESARGHQGGQSHENHCHESVASCSDQPITGISAFALLAESVALIGVAGALVAVAARWWQPRRPVSLLPELQPPRLPAFASI